MCVILHMSVITQDGWSALIWAAYEGKTEAVVQLVKAGANVDMQNAVRTCAYTYMYKHNVQLHVHVRTCIYGQCTCMWTCTYLCIRCTIMHVHTCTMYVYGSDVWSNM